MMKVKVMMRSVCSFHTKDTGEQRAVGSYVLKMTQNVLLVQSTWYLNNASKAKDKKTQTLKELN